MCDFRASGLRESAVATLGHSGYPASRVRCGRQGLRALTWSHAIRKLSSYFGVARRGQLRSKQTEVEQAAGPTMPRPSELPFNLKLQVAGSGRRYLGAPQPPGRSGQRLWAASTPLRWEKWCQPAPGPGGPAGRPARAAQPRVGCWRPGPAASGPRPAGWRCQPCVTGMKKSK